MLALEALEKWTLLTSLTAAASWRGNTKARKTNNPVVETKDDCLVEAGHPGGKNRWGGAELK